MTVISPDEDSGSRGLSFRLSSIPPLTVFLNAYASVTSGRFMPLPPPDPTTFVPACAEDGPDRTGDQPKIGLFRRFLRWFGFGVD